MMRKKMVESAKESMEQKVGNSEMYIRMQSVFIEMDTSASVRKTKHVKKKKTQAFLAL